MTEASKSGVPWRRGVAEFVIIFGGVSLGLLADDVRQRVEEAGEAQEALVQMAADLENDSAELASASEVLVGHSAATAIVQRNWARSDPDLDSVALAVRAYLRLPIVYFRRSAFESLRASNRLSLLEPPVLQRAVVEYYDEQAQLTVLQDMVREAKEATVDAFSPYMIRPPSADPSAGLPLSEVPIRFTVPWRVLSQDNVPYNAISYSGSVSETQRRGVEELRLANSELLGVVRGAIGSAQR